jgi:hypothetical protein
MNARGFGVLIVACLAAGACGPAQPSAGPSLPAATVTLSSLQIEIKALDGNSGLARTWRFQATARGMFPDGTVDDLTGRVTWTSSNPAVAVISNSGLISAQGPGDTGIQAALQGVSAIVFMCIEAGAYCGG